MPDRASPADQTRLITMPNHDIAEGACTEFSAVLRDTGRAYA
jgi:hypothetical protein